MESIVQAIARHATKNSKRTCIIEANGAIETYADFWKQIVLWALKLKQLNVKKNDIICIESVQESRFLELLFACQLIGAIYVPLENGFKKERLYDIRKEVGECLTIVSSDEKKDEHNVYTYEMIKKLEASEDNGLEFPKENEVSEILYTTGTTGKSKGIVLTNGNDVALAENIIYGTEMKPDSIEMIPLPLSHSHGLRTCYAHFLNGSAVLLMDGISNIKKIFEMLDKYNVNALDLTPSAAKILLRLSKQKLLNYQKQIDYVELGTAFLDEEIKEQLCKMLPYSRLYNFYGSTESGRSCVLNFNDDIVRPACIGKPAKNAEFIVVDDEGKEIESSKENLGLLAVAGKMNMLEYYMEPKLTEEVLCDEYVRTHDVGYIEDGYVYVLGRADDVINCRGIKIAPEEIEAIAMKYSSQIIDCGCIAMTDSISGQVPKLFVEIGEKGNNEESFLQNLRKYLCENLEENRIPKIIEVIDKIPRTENGKVLRRILREGN